MNLKQYNQAQIHAINIYKWIESERAGYDLGEKSIIQWIKLNGKQFREQWEKEHNNQ